MISFVTLNQRIAMTIILKSGASKERISEIVKLLNSPKKKALNTKKYAGKTQIKADPLTVQKEMRDEWN